MKALITHIVESNFDYQRITYKVFFYKENKPFMSQDVEVIFSTVTSPTTLLEAIDNAVIEYGKKIGVDITSEDIIKA